MIRFSGFAFSLDELTCLTRYIKWVELALRNQTMLINLLNLFIIWVISLHIEPDAECLMIFLNLFEF